MTQKSADFAAKHNLAERLEIDEKAGVISTGEDFYAATLVDVGLTLDQVKKLQKHDAKLLAATTLVAGEKAAELFKKNEDLTEISFNYSLGNNKAHGYFSRDGQTPVRNIVETYGSAGGELGKVHKHVKTLFDNINS